MPPPERFVLNPVTDLEGCEELRRRVEVSKQLVRLVPVRNHDAIPAAVVRLLKSLSKSNGAQFVRSVGVVVNRVRVARDTHQDLEKAGFAAHC